MENNAKEIFRISLRRIKKVRAKFFKGNAFKNAQGQKNLLSFLALPIREKINTLCRSRAAEWRFLWMQKE